MMDVGHVKRQACQSQSESLLVHHRKTKSFKGFALTDSARNKATAETKHIPKGRATTVELT